MKHYSNIVLTIIAMALSAIAVENVVDSTRALAQRNELIKVQICGYTSAKAQPSQFGCANLGPYLNPVSGNTGVALSVNSLGLAN